MRLYITDMLPKWDGKPQVIRFRLKHAAPYTCDKVETPGSRKGYFLVVCVVSGRDEYEWMYSRN